MRRTGSSDWSGSDTAGRVLAQRPAAKVQARGQITRLLRRRGHGAGVERVNDSGAAHGAIAAIEEPAT